MRELAFLEVGVDPHLVERHDGHQRRTGVHALPDLDAAPGYVARDRRGKRGARKTEVGLAHSRRGALHVGMRLERSAVDQRALRLGLALRRVERRARGGDAIDRVLQLLARDRARGLDRAAAGEILLGLGELRPPHRNAGVEAGAGGLEVAHAAHRLGELRFGLIERHLGIGLVELDQHLAGLDVIGVVRADGEHGSRDLRRHLHEVAADVRVVRRLVVAPDDQPPCAVTGAGQQKDEQHQPH